MKKKDETTALQNNFECVLQQRFIHCNENGVIFYQTYWFPWLACLSKVDMEKSKGDEALSLKKETDPTALRFDPFSIAFTRKSIKYLTPLTGGDIPLEISRFVYFFLQRGGKMVEKCILNKV